MRNPGFFAEIRKDTRAPTAMLVSGSISSDSSAGFVITGTPTAEGLEIGGCTETAETGGAPGNGFGVAELGDVAGVPDEPPSALSGKRGSGCAADGFAVTGGGDAVAPSRMRTERDVSSSCAVAGQMQQIASSAPAVMCWVQDNIIP